MLKPILKIVGSAKRYFCPIEGCDHGHAPDGEPFSSLKRWAVVEHAQAQHGTELAGPWRGKKHAVTHALPDLQGETIVIGAAPQRVTVTVSNGIARREIVTFAHSMADTVDTIAVALRETPRARR